MAFGQETMTLEREQFKFCIKSTLNEYPLERTLPLSARAEIPWGTLKYLDEDTDVIEKGEEESKNTYERALERRNISESALMELAWSHVGFENLQNLHKSLKQEVSAILNLLTLNKTRQQIMQVKEKLLQYFKGLYSRKRTAATHLLVFMISDELRNCKPYAIPVRFMAYNSLTDSALRSLEQQLELEMKSEGLIPVGKQQ